MRFIMLIGLALFVSGPASAGLVCGFYYRDAASSTPSVMSRGPYSTDPANTASVAACYSYLQSQYFEKGNCTISTSASSVLRTGVLMPESSYSATMPSNLASSQIVSIVDRCPASDVSDKVCAVYYRKNNGTRMIQGPWINESQFTSSSAACSSWLSNNVMNKPNCAVGNEPEGYAAMGVLLNKSRFSFDLPTDLTSAETVLATRNCDDTLPPSSGSGGGSTSGGGTTAAASAKSCVLYYRKAQENNMVKGPGSDLAANTASARACYDFVATNYLSKKNCGVGVENSGGVVASVLLLDSSKASSALPSGISSSELISYAQKCPAGDSNGKVCAIYYKKKDDSRFVQGTWTEDGNVTKSVSACFSYMAKNALKKANCAQPEGAYGVVVLIDKAKAASKLPPVDIDSEFVTGMKCAERDQ